MKKHEITLDYAISLMDAQVGELGGVTGVVLYAEDICQYLKEYRDLRAILPDKLVAYFGHRPVVQIDGYYFAVRYYDKNSGAWRCDRVEESSITGEWVCTDDDTYVIDNKGTVLYREVGWGMRKEPYEKGKVSK